MPERDKPTVSEQSGRVPRGAGPDAALDDDLAAVAARVAALESTVDAVPGAAVDDLDDTPTISAVFDNDEVAAAIGGVAGAFNDLLASLRAAGLIEESA